MTISRFQKTILNWYKTNRRDLPWRPPTSATASGLRRGKADFYKILVSEIMLQQTQVSRVLPKYKEFLSAFPTLEKLAKAPNAKLLKVWQGLGYWRRAKYLKQIAQILTSEKKQISGNSAQAILHGSPRAKNRRAKRPLRPLGGDEPFARNLFLRPKELETLPGIGHYTARALACFAFGNTEAFLDTNIRRVYLHFFFPKKENVSDSEILPIAQKAIDAFRLRPAFQRDFGVIREWHYALFDYGALVLKNKKINKQSKHYAKQSEFEGSFRYFRTKALQQVLSHGTMQKTEFTQFLKKLLKEKKSKYQWQAILSSLSKDNLIKQKADKISI